MEFDEVTDVRQRHRQDERLPRRTEDRPTGPTGIFAEALKFPRRFSLCAARVIGQLGAVSG